MALDWHKALLRSRNPALSTVKAYSHWAMFSLDITLLKYSIDYFSDL